MIQPTSIPTFRTFNSTPMKRDSPVRWALNVCRLSKDAGSAIAIQERDGSIYVCVRKGEATNWVPFQRVMTPLQLQSWIQDGGFSLNQR